jgi:hypothetical protein
MQSAFALRATVLAGIVFLTLLFVSPAHAATRAFITWQATTAVPAGYFGRVLPNRTSPISVAVFATTDDSLVNLSKAMIKWYVNDEFLISGIGRTTISLAPENPPAKTLVVRAVIKDSEAAPSEVTASVSIPRTYPTLVVPLQQQQALRSERLVMRAIPFFFSQTDEPLQYRWRVNDRIRSIINDVLVLDTSASGENQVVQVFVDATHPKNIVETAATELTVRIP